MKPSLLAVGDTLVDLLASVDEAFLASIPLRKGGWMSIDSDRLNGILQALPSPPPRCLGGSAANAVRGFSMLGGHAAFLGAAGQDDFGAFASQVLREDGVEDRLKVVAGAPTGICLALVTPDQERSFCTCYGVNDLLTPDRVTEADVEGHTHLLLEGYAFKNAPLVLRLVALARRHGLRVCLDAGSPEVVRGHSDFLWSLLRQRAIDILFANEEEATALADIAEPLQALEALSDFCGITVVKLGKQGAWIQAQGKVPLRIPACQVDTPVDTTGAGDLWAAGFLFGILHGFSLEQSGKLGAVTAAEVVQVSGATLPLQTWERIRIQAGTAL